jgi:hypothetical protein
MCQTLQCYNLTEQSFSGNPDSRSVDQEIPRLLWNLKDVTVFIKDRERSLSWAKLMKSTPSHIMSFRYILIFSSHVRLGLPTGLYHSGFPTKMLYMFLNSPWVLHTPPIHSIGYILSNNEH